MTPSRSLILLGATGAVGRHVLTGALNGDLYERVTVVTRRPLTAHQGHPKLEVCVVDFDNLAAHTAEITGTDLINAMGTTHKKAGSKERFIQIDHGYPLEVAQIAHRNGAHTCILISSLGADPGSNNNYLKTKGRLEQDVQALGFETVVTLRPSMLKGERDEVRLGEEAGKLADRVFGFLIPARYRAVDVQQVAKRALKAAQQRQPGWLAIENEDIRTP